MAEQDEPVHLQDSGEVVTEQSPRPSSVCATVSSAAPPQCVLFELQYNGVIVSRSISLFLLLLPEYRKPELESLFGHR